MNMVSARAMKGMFTFKHNQDKNKENHDLSRTISKGNTSPHDHTHASSNSSRHQNGDGSSAHPRFDATLIDDPKVNDAHFCLVNNIFLDQLLLRLDYVLLRIDGLVYRPCYNCCADDVAFDVGDSSAEEHDKDDCCNRIFRFDWTKRENDKIVGKLVGQFEFNCVLDNLFTFSCRYLRGPPFLFRQFFQMVKSKFTLAGKISEPVSAQDQQSASASSSTPAEDWKYAIFKKDILQWETMEKTRINNQGIE
jgi:hypothetical protein